DYVPAGFPADQHVTVSLEYGPDHDRVDPFDISVARVAQDDPLHSHDARYLHPVVRFYRQGQMRAEHHVAENLENEWNGPMHGPAAPRADQGLLRGGTERDRRFITARSGDPGAKPCSPFPYASLSRKRASGSIRRSTIFSQAAPTTSSLCERTKRHSTASSCCPGCCAGGESRSWM